MAPAIHIAKSGARSAPTLPADAVTRTFGIFGMKDSGKTNTGRVVTEGIVKVGGHAIVFDPVGVWWGATRAGEGPGIAGVVIGGEHGDVPLEETGGKLIAELALAREYKLIVVDMKLLRKGAQRRFLADCLEELYFRNRLPLSVVFEEADQSLPQNPRGMDPTLGRVLGAAEDIVKLGRSRGLGGILISQRLATVNKNVTEQIENLILLRLVGPNDIKAVKEWVQSNGDPVATAKVLDTIAKLEQGEAWMYSPGWLKLLERIRVRHARTLDSSATPTIEQVQAEESAARAPVSLDQLRDQMAATVERAKANDPGELRKVIEGLQDELQEANDRAESAGGERVIVPDARLVSELSEAAVSLEAGVEELIAERERLAADVDRATVAMTGTADELWKRIEAGSKLVAEAREVLQVAGEVPKDGRPVPGKLPEIAPRAAPRAAPAKRTDVGLLSIDSEISAGAERLYGEMTELAPLRLRRTQLATILRRGVKSSTLTTQLAELKAAGLVDEQRGLLGVTSSDGMRGLSRDELVERWQAALPEGPRSMFEVLLNTSDRQPIEKGQLFLLAGFSPTSSTPVTHLKLLRDNELAAAENGGVRLGPAVAA